MGGRWEPFFFEDQINSYHRVMVETGTYLGERTNIFSGIFETVYSIELSETLYDRAVEEFKSHLNVTLIHGDSAEEIKVLCEKIQEPCVFYLDAHWFVDKEPVSDINPSPILQELDAIKRRDWPDIVVVDDVHQYGRTMDEWAVPANEVPEQMEMWKDINTQFLLDYMEGRVFRFKNTLDKTFMFLK